MTLLLFSSPHAYPMSLYHSINTFTCLLAFLELNKLLIQLLSSEKTESLEEDKEEDEKEGSLAASVVSELEAEDSSMIEVTINKLVDLDKMEIIVHKAV